jgi:rhodanese-related sulfurtransferase
VQGRLAADAICGRDTKFRGVQPTAICGVFGLAVASTGASEKSLRRAGVTDYEKIYLHPGNHASYFPGAKPINIKLIFHKPDGRILGAQAVGDADVDKRIDAIAAAIQFGGTVFDLEEMELCYVPQFGGAKDPVNYAGMIAANHLRGDLPLADWKQLAAGAELLVDVRDANEFQTGHVPGAINLPLNQIRHRLGELPRDREVWLYCGVGQRAYYAARVLMQNGFHVKTLPGGFCTYNLIQSSNGH